MRKFWRGLIGLFVDDLWLAFGVVAWVGVTAWLGRVAVLPLAACVALPAGLLGLLAFSVLSAARAKRTSALLSGAGTGAIGRDPRGP